jgi:hypothetical protein
MPRACLPFLATAGILAGCRLENRRYVAVRGGARCRLVSPCVAPEKDPKEPEWEVDCVTYSLDRNILNLLSDNDL